MGEACSSPGLLGELIAAQRASELSRASGSFAGTTRQLLMGNERTVSHPTGTAIGGDAASSFILRLAVARPVD